MDPRCVLAEIRGLAESSAQWSESELVNAELDLIWCYVIYGILLLSSYKIPCSWLAGFVINDKQYILKKIKVR